MSDILELQVALGARSYPIFIGSGLLAQAAELIAAHAPCTHAIIVTDRIVAPLYAAALEQALHTRGIRTAQVVVEAGEGAKQFSVLETLCEDILTHQPDRRTVIIALGGGVVGDLAGFAASILLRGIPFVQIPTTLLAQVDSSVGGKTAINARAGKNLIGSFYQPKLVLADLATLSTLSMRQRLAGYAEIIKYGFIMDAKFYRWCLANAAALVAGDSALLQHAVAACCRMKADIVRADEREAGARALLNFGHTFGHALEAETGMGETLLHGEAVAIGMVMACRLSARMGLLDDAVEHELATHLAALGLPAHPRDIENDWNAARLAAHFVADKKAENGTLTFIVLDVIGRARVAKAVDPILAISVVESFL